MIRLPSPLALLAAASLGAVSLGSGSLGSGCAVEAPADPSLPRIPAAGGKADNYISTNAREWILSGEAHFPLGEAFAGMTETEKEAELARLAGSRLSQVSRAMQSHIQNVLRENNDGTTGEDAKYFIYVKRDAGEAEGAEALDETYGRFTFALELVGSNDLVELLAPDAEGSFAVSVPGTGTDDAEPVTVEIRPTASVDAFPRYDALFEDGVYDVGVHFGGDYNTERYDIETAKWFAEYLIEEGWTNEGAASFDELTFDSPPFTKSLLIEGKPVEGRVYITHADMDGGGDQTPLRTRMEESLREYDVVIYSGHAGPGAGFILDYSPRYEIRASDFGELEMADKYQIFLLDGCETYRSYVDDLMKNPNKTFDNVDIITTVNTTPFSAGYQTLHEMITWLTLTDGEGNHHPMSWGQILRGINTDEFRGVYYGVHGVDQDPQINPNGHEGVACTSCVTDDDCPGGGNYCLNIDDVGRCGVACTTDEACGLGFGCATVFEHEDDWYRAAQCIPNDSSCN
jgi:hypothetical protein